jgi:hypothetical protein
MAFLIRLHDAVDVAGGKESGTTARLAPLPGWARLNKTGSLESPNMSLEYRRKI